MNIEPNMHSKVYERLNSRLIRLNYSLVYLIIRLKKRIDYVLVYKNKCWIIVKNLKLFQSFSKINSLLKRKF